MMQNYNYSLHEIEHMIPWEREVYVSMLINHLKEKREQEQKNRSSNFK